MPVEILMIVWLFTPIYSTRRAVLRSLLLYLHWYNILYRCLEANGIT